jgi:hypothetical protein
VILLEASDLVGFEEVLNPLERLTVKDSLVLALEPLSAVMHFTDVDPVLQKVGEGTVGKGNASLVFCTLCVTCLVTIFRRSSSATSLPKDFCSR